MIIHLAITSFKYHYILPMKRVEKLILIEITKIRLLKKQLQTGARFLKAHRDN